MRLPERMVRMNRYYQLTHFYTFLKDLAVRALGLVIFFVVSLYVLDTFIIDLDSLLTGLLANFSKSIIFTVFLVSESILGLIPPELFIALTAKSVYPWVDLFIIASISYTGGIIAYFAGKQLYRIPIVHKYIEHKISRHIKNLRQWGGVLILIGAMLPIPHAIISMASGVIRFKFSHYLLWALARYLRFFVYGLTIFNIVNF